MKGELSVLDPFDVRVNEACCLLPLYYTSFGRKADTRLGVHKLEIFVCSAVATFGLE